MINVECKLHGHSSCTPPHCSGRGKEILLDGGDQEANSWRCLRMNSSGRVTIYSNGQVEINSNTCLVHYQQIPSGSSVSSSSVPVCLSETVDWSGLRFWGRPKLLGQRVHRRRRRKTARKLYGEPSSSSSSTIRYQVVDLSLESLHGPLELPRRSRAEQHTRNRI